jgi:hypothetical protein
MDAFGNFDECSCKTRSDVQEKVVSHSRNCLVSHHSTPFYDTLFDIILALSNTYCVVLESSCDEVPSHLVLQCFYAPGGSMSSMVAKLSSHVAVRLTSRS